MLCFGFCQHKALAGQANQRIIERYDEQKRAEEDERDSEELLDLCIIPYHDGYFGVQGDCGGDTDMFWLFSHRESADFANLVLFSDLTHAHLDSLHSPLLVLAHSLL